MSYRTQGASSRKHRARHSPGVSHNQVRTPLYIVICFIVLGIVALCSVGAPFLTSYDPTMPVLEDRLLPPFWMHDGSLKHPFGTDQLGYDVLSRMLYGSRFSISIALMATVIGATMGVTMGVLAGHFRGAVDWLISLAADAWLATPFLVIALVAVITFGHGWLTLTVLIGVSSWAQIARACRSRVFSLTGQEFIMAGMATGVSESGIMLRYILPNLMPLILVLVTINLRGYILAEAALSFLGLGRQPPNPSWGDMVNQGRAYLLTAWWISLCPSLLLVLTVMSVSLIGDWLQSRFDPTLRDR